LSSGYPVVGPVPLYADGLLTHAVCVEAINKQPISKQPALV